MSLYSIMSFPSVWIHHHLHANAWPCYLCPSSPEHNSNSALSLHRAFNIVLVVLKGNFDSELAILSVILTTFRFTIPLLDVVADRLHLHETSWQICHVHRLHFDFLQKFNWIHGEKYHPCPAMICVIIDNIIAFPPTQTCSCFVLHLEFLDIQLMFCSTLA